VLLAVPSDRHAQRAEWAHDRGEVEALDELGAAAADRRGQGAAAAEHDKVAAAQYGRVAGQTVGQQPNGDAAGDREVVELVAGGDLFDAARLEHRTGRDGAAEQLDRAAARYDRIADGAT